MSSLIFATIVLFEVTMAVTSHSYTINNILPPQASFFNDGDSTTRVTLDNSQSSSSALHWFELDFG